MDEFIFSINALILAFAPNINMVNDIIELIVCFTGSILYENNLYIKLSLKMSEQLHSKLYPRSIMFSYRRWNDFRYTRYHKREQINFRDYNIIVFEHAFIINIYTNTAGNNMYWRLVSPSKCIKNVQMILNIGYDNFGWMREITLTTDKIKWIYGTEDAFIDIAKDKYSINSTKSRDIETREVMFDANIPIKIQIINIKYIDRFISIRNDAQKEILKMQRQTISKTKQKIKFNKRCKAYTTPKSTKWTFHRW